jgi:hypothetical protein
MEAYYHLILLGVDYKRVVMRRVKRLLLHLHSEELVSDNLEEEQEPWVCIR